MARSTLAHNNQQEALRDVSSGNIGLVCSKWQRLNQEVKKTTKKNKLIKTAFSRPIRRQLLLQITALLGCWIYNHTNTR
jgi:uncharacterized lipoprotein YajG